MKKQILWMESLDPDQIRRKFDIVRAPTDGSKRSFLILSPVLTVCPTHWIGRTQPCTRPNCDSCDRGQVPEIKSWVIAVDLKSEEKHLVEFTAPPTAVLKEWQDQNGTVNGLGIRLSRKNDKSNGPVHLQIVHHDLSTAKFGMPPDVREILQTMWRFNPELAAAAGPLEESTSGTAGSADGDGHQASLVAKQKVSKVKVKRRKRS